MDKATRIMGKDALMLFQEAQLKIILLPVIVNSVTFG